MQPALNLDLEDRPEDASIRAARDIACLLDQGASIDAKQLRQLEWAGSFNRAGQRE